MLKNGDLAKDLASRHILCLLYDNAYVFIENKNINTVYITTTANSYLEYTDNSLNSSKNVNLEEPTVIGKLHKSKGAY